MTPKATKPRVASETPPQPTREAILDAAERMFAAKGVDGVAVRDLARELGLTASSLYNHFPGKQALHEAVLERGLRPIVEVVTAVWQREVDEDSIGRTIDALVAHLGERQHLGPLVQRALLEESAGVHDLLRRWFAPLYSRGVHAIAHAAEGAGWQRDDVPYIAMGIFGMIFAYFVNAQAMERYGTFGGDALAPAALAGQRRFLEKAIYRLLGRRQPGEPA